MGGQRIVVKIRCIAVKKIQMHCGLKSKNFVPVWIRSAVLHARFRLARAAANSHIHCTSETGELSLPVFCLGISKVP